nr:EOG090X0ETF [Lepidurus arcticus]
MWKLCSKTLLLLLLVLPLILTVTNPASHVAYAEDELEGEDDVPEDADVADDGAQEADVLENAEEAESEDSPKASPNADATIIFTKPIGSSNMDLPAGKIVEFLVGFTNKGDQDMLVESIDAAFLYPMDHTFVIQNFSAVHYLKAVKPGQQSSFAYSFIPADAFAGRPFGLSVNLAYRDMDNRAFRQSLFNETINIVEVDEGLDGETLFLYIFLAAGAVLLLVLGQQALVAAGKKRLGTGKSESSGAKSTSSVSDDGIDYDWIPKGTLSELNKSPKKSPRRSPRQPRYFFIHAVDTVGKK